MTGVNKRHLVIRKDTECSMCPDVPVMAIQADSIKFNQIPIN